MAGAWISEGHVRASETGAGVKRTAVGHATWCDLSRCMAGRARVPALEGGRCSTPEALLLDTDSGDVTVAASLFQVHTPWLTSVFVEFTIDRSEDASSPSGQFARMLEVSSGEVTP